MLQSFIKLLVLSILVIIAGLFDCGKQIKHLTTVRQQEKAAQAELANSYRAMIKPRSQFTLHTKDELIEFFLYQANKNGLALKSLSSARLIQDGVVSLDAVLEGGFPAVLDFFASLQRACFPFLINHFTLFMNHADLNLALQLTLLGMCEKNQAKVIIKNNNSDPFVTSLGDFSDAEKKRQKLLNDFSVKQMHLVGYLQSATERLAIVKLPDGETIEVHPGEVVGRIK